MASIIMHLYMSTIIKDKLNLSDKFVAASILPDLLKCTELGAKKTHFQDESNLPNLKSFIIENNIQDDISLGYYSHLYQDYMWFGKYIQNKFGKPINGKIKVLKNNSLIEYYKFRQDIYNDYDLIDKYLIRKINLNIEKIKEVCKYEFKKYNIDNIIDQTIKCPKVRNETFQIFTIDEFNSYITETQKGLIENILHIKEN